jgi:NAD(P)-dependent dehydrogenase (short-subunit alcohol dehydrogenase family)
VNITVELEKQRTGLLREEAVLLKHVFPRGFHLPSIHLHTTRPTASFKGKTVIVTGSNVGLGLEASRWIVRLGASQVILACRNVEKGKAAAKDIQATTSCSSGSLQVWHLDISSYVSVQAFTDRVKAELPRLDVLLGDAGVGTNKF